MPKLGVVSCQILELEFALILVNDPDVTEILVIENQFSKDLLEKLENDFHTTDAACFYRRLC